MSVSLHHGAGLYDAAASQKMEVEAEAETLSCIGSGHVGVSQAPWYIEELSKERCSSEP